MEPGDDDGHAFEFEEDGKPWWTSGLFGSGYGAAGLAATVASRHLGDPWRIVLGLVGLALALVAGWILLWFVAMLVIELLDHRFDWSPRVVPTVGVVVVVLAAWIVYSIRR